MVIKSIKDSLFKIFGSKSQDAEYIELDLGEEVEKSKVIVKPFVLRKFEDVNHILNALRQGYTIAIIDIKPLKGKDIIELKKTKDDAFKIVGQIMIKTDKAELEKKLEDRKKLLNLRFI